MEFGITNAGIIIVVELQGAGPDHLRIRSWNIAE